MPLSKMFRVYTSVSLIVWFFVGRFTMAGDEYEVERIVDKRIGEDGTVEYFIKWKDWDESTNTCKFY